MEPSLEKKFLSPLTEDQLLLVESLQVPLLVLDPELKVEYTNDPFRCIFGTSEKLLGLDFFDLHKKWDQEELRQAFRCLFSEKKTFKDYQLPHPNPKKKGSFFYLAASLFPREGNYLLLTLNEQKSETTANEGVFLPRLREIFMQAPAAIAVVHGPGHIYTLANSLYERLFNRTSKELLGKSIQEVFPEIEGQGIYDLFHQVFTSGEAFIAQEYQVNFERKGKGQFEIGYFNFMAHPIKDAEGTTTDIMIHAFEVTDHVLARKKLEESERRFRELIYSSPFMIAIYRGKDMIIETANDAMLETWGKNQEVLDRSLFEVLPEIKNQGFLEMVEQVFKTGEPHESHELPVNLYRNGETQLGYYNFMFYPRRDAEGEVIGIFHIATEVTPEAEMNRKIRESEAHFRQMADLMPEKITNNDPEGNPIYFNQAWLDFSGLSSEELRTRGWNESIHPEDLPPLLENWHHCLKTGKEYEISYRALNRDGRYVWQLTRGVPIKDEAGKIKLWITTATDIQKLKEEESRKEDFLKMVSHELKTPITSIKGYVQLLLSLLKSEQAKDIPASLPLKPSLNRIDQQISRLTRLISDILDLSRLEDDRLELKKENFSINYLVDETVQDILFTNPQHEIKIIHNFNCTLKGDKDRIGQVLINS